MRVALVAASLDILGGQGVQAQALVRALREDGVDAKLRYRSAPVRARVDETADGFSLELVEPAEAVAPGQVAVLYDDDIVVGAGVIERATG